jgi:hypothetical protein
MSEIGDLIKQLTKQYLDNEEIYFKTGTATNVNRTDFTFTFTPNDEQSDVEKCLLKTIQTGSGGSFVIIPEEDSFVMVAFSSDVTAICVFVEVAQEIIIRAQTITREATDIDTMADESISTSAKNKTTAVTETYAINAAQTIFNDGNNFGLVKIVKLTTKLNNHISEFNDFVSKFNTHKHTGVSTGGAVSGNPNTTATDADTFNKSDYENTDVTH